MIHESCGTVIPDPTGTHEGQKLLHSQSVFAEDEEFYENCATGTHFCLVDLMVYGESLFLLKDRVVFTCY